MQCKDQRTAIAVIFALHTSVSHGTKFSSHPTLANYRSKRMTSCPCLVALRAAILLILASSRHSSAEGPFRLPHDAEKNIRTCKCFVMNIMFRRITNLSIQEELGTVQSRAQNATRAPAELIFERHLRTIRCR